MFLILLIVINFVIMLSYMKKKVGFLIILEEIKMMLKKLKLPKIFFPVYEQKMIFQISIYGRHDLFH